MFNHEKFITSLMNNLYIEIIYIYNYLNIEIKKNYFERLREYMIKNYVSLLRFEKEFKNRE